MTTTQVVKLSELAYEFLGYGQTCVLWGPRDIWPPKHNHFICESKWPFAPNMKKLIDFLFLFSSAWHKGVATTQQDQEHHTKVMQWWSWANPNWSCSNGSNSVNYFFMKWALIWGRWCHSCDDDIFMKQSWLVKHLELLQQQQGFRHVFFSSTCKRSLCEQAQCQWVWMKCFSLVLHYPTTIRREARYRRAQCGPSAPAPSACVPSLLQYPAALFTPGATQSARVRIPPSSFRKKGCRAMFAV